MKDENMKILKTMILTWDDEQVRDAWDLISKEGKRRSMVRSTKIKANIAVGDTVSFAGNKSGKCTGKVVKVKYKKAIIDVKGRNWDVPFHMLEKVI